MSYICKLSKLLQFLAWEMLHIFSFENVGTYFLDVWTWLFQPGVVGNAFSPE